MALTTASELFSDQVLRGQHTTLLLILTAGGFFSALVTLTDVLLQRRHLGRRRALGITRSALTFLTTARMLYPALMGASAGTLLSVSIAHVTLGIAIPREYAAAIVILTSFAAGLAALLPAIWASQRDPVRVLRSA